MGKAEGALAEHPAVWSQLATDIVASKYFRSALDHAKRETSVRQLIGRVVDTLTAWGREDRFFHDEEDAATFHAEGGVWRYDRSHSVREPGGLA